MTIQDMLDAGIELQGHISIEEYDSEHDKQNILATIGDGSKSLANIRCASESIKHREIKYLYVKGDVLVVEVDFDEETVELPSEGNGWILTDDDCCQYRKHVGGREYELYQIIDLSCINKPFEVAHATIDVAGADEDDIEAARDAFSGLWDESCMSSEECDALKAEALFEMDALSLTEKKFSRYNDAVAYIVQAIHSKK